MIFSKLFKTKAKWQHKDASTRIMAINEDLSAKSSEQLTILKTLLSQDSSDLVRRAALVKVSTLDCYLDTIKNNDQEKIKQFAQKQVHDILTSTHKVIVTNEQKKALLSQQDTIALLGPTLLEAWLSNEQDSAIMIALYQKISERKTTTHFLTHSFSQKQDPNFQDYIINQVEDPKILEKLSKKACNETLTQKIKDKLSTIQANIDKPIKLEKQLQLTLAKLQALKDVADYGEYKRRKVQLINEWQTFANNFEVFSEDKCLALIEKYESIISHLEKLFIAKAENYQQQIIADKLLHDKQQDKKEFTQQLNQISQSITTAVFSNDTVDEASFKGTLKQLTTSIKSSVLNKEEQHVFITQVVQLTKRLNEIPEIAESVSQATNLISKVSQLTLPITLEELNDREQTYKDWLKSWRMVESKSAGILPESIVQSQKEIVSTWQSGLKSLKSKQKELFFQQKKKLQDIKRLLNNGKYKVCFGLFKGVKESIHLLSTQQYQQLQRDFDLVNDKMAELSDWEHYIATPRKQELLLAIQALVDTPLDNPNEQAAKVKAYRSTWNSLGHADEDLDKQLNEQFNVGCEQAFAPCRLYYLEQDKVRVEHLKQREKILERAEQCVSQLTETDNTPPLDLKKLNNQYNALQQEWNNAGEVDRKQYKNLQVKFKNAMAPIKSAINVFYANNTTKKEALISQAKALLDDENVLSAIEKVKGLQQNWREVGFSGSQQENPLWQTFREINDQLFAKRAQFKSEQQAVVSEQQAMFTEKVQLIETSFNEVALDVDNQNLQTVAQQAEGLLNEITSTKPVIKSLVNRLEKITKAVAQKVENNKTVKEQQIWSSLFELMSSQAQHNQDLEIIQTSNAYRNMSTFWQKRFQEQVKLISPAPDMTRFDKTLAIEILAKSDSPAELAEQRMKIQVQLIQEQMLSSTEIDLNILLVDWLMLGKLTEADLPLIQRLHAIYCAKNAESAETQS